MIRSLRTIYSPVFPKVVVYMLQTTEYQIGKYLKWLWSVKDYTTVIHRKSLVLTGPSRALLVAIGAGMTVQYIGSLGWAIWVILKGDIFLIGYPLAMLLLTPAIWAHLVIIPLLFGKYLIIKPSHYFHIHRSKDAFSIHSAFKIAVAGSYGKTTMKEMLLTVLSEGKKVAATPANENVAISHARFAKRLTGEEDILIIEFGEGAPGDIAKFAKVTKPNLAIITGLAPAHLDKYKTVKKAGEDIFSLSEYLNESEIYVNGESSAALPFIRSGHNIYSSKSVVGWVIKNIKVSINGVIFDMKKKNKTLRIKSKLLGAHQVGPLALVAALSEELGLSTSDIETGIAKIEPFEHRMQPRNSSGAWILDDTYNGNIDGMKAGLQLLKELPAKRKIYVTPGLVDQGPESDAIHEELGVLIAKSNPDIAVLMKHSVTTDIKRGLEKGSYKGKTIIEDDPLDFYNNIDKFIASGDLLLMQNDWPDNYS